MIVPRAGAVRDLVDDLFVREKRTPPGGQHLRGDVDQAVDQARTNSRGAHRFVPTGHAGGAWDTSEQHFSPLGGLIVHEIERVRAREHAQPSR